MSKRIPLTVEAIAKHALAVLDTKELLRLIDLITTEQYERREQRHGYCWCGCGRKTSIARATDTRQGRIKGEPTRWIPGHQQRISGVDYVVEDRGHDSPCWVWQRRIGTGGYGHANVRLDNENKGMYAHRLYYERYVGPIAEGLQIHHLCKVRACVNPKHLEPLTRIEHQRLSPQTKLNVTKARQIKQLLGEGVLNHREIAELFGVSRALISDINAGKRWSDA